MLLLVVSYSILKKSSKGVLEDMANLSNECHISSLLSAFFGRTAAEPSFSPPQLRGMEIIRLAGYVYEEKLAIANHYLIPQTIATWWAIFSELFLFFPQRCFGRMAENQMVQ